MRINLCLFRSFLGILLTAFLSNTLLAQAPLELQRAQKCLRLIYTAQYDSARFVAKSFSEQEPVLKNLVEVFGMRWEFIPIVKHAKKEEYLKKLHATLDRIEESNVSSASYLYLHATAELLVAEYHYLKGDATQAIWHGKKAYPLMMEAFDTNSQAGELLFIQGMYLYYSEFFREKGFVYRAALFPLRNGDKEKGLEALKKAAVTESLAQTEAIIYLAHMYLHLEKKPESALSYSRTLVERYPGNLKFREVLLENLISAAMYKEAEALLSEQLKTENMYYRIPALYFKGVLEKDVEKNMAKAKKSFSSCIELVKKNNLHEDYAAKAQAQLDELQLNLDELQLN